MHQLHDVNSAARLLAVSPWTVRAYIRAGKLNPVRLGRLVRITHGELERFVQSASGPDVSAEGMPSSTEAAAS
jgi:excisionase family DNA binding protein